MGDQQNREARAGSAVGAARDPAQHFTHFFAQLRVERTGRLIEQ
jgi:hypothetical protein